MLIAVTVMMVYRLEGGTGGENSRTWTGRRTQILVNESGSLGDSSRWGGGA